MLTLFSVSSSPVSRVSAFFWTTHVPSLSSIDDGFLLVCMVFLWTYACDNAHEDSYVLMFL